MEVFATCLHQFHQNLTKIDGGVFILTFVDRKKKAKMPKKAGKSRTSNATLTRAIKRISEARKASEKGLEDSPHRHPESSKAGQSMAVTNGKEYY